MRSSAIRACWPRRLRSASRSRRDDHHPDRIRRWTGGRQAIELLMGIVCRVISEVVGGRWHPESAHFVHAAPGDLSVHRRVFQCPLVFGSEFNGFACPTASLDAPNPAADRSWRAMPGAISTCWSRRPPTARSPSGRGARSICCCRRGAATSTGRRQSRPASARAPAAAREGRPDLRDPAQRGPARAGAALSVEARPTMSTAIAQMTGYASPSSFTRWFAAEFGMAPAAWRAEGHA